MEKNYNLAAVLTALNVQEWNCLGQHLNPEQKKTLFKNGLSPRRWTCFLNNSVTLTTDEIRVIADMLNIPRYTLLMNEEELKTLNLLEAA